MEFLDQVKARYSVRRYSDQPVEEEKLAKILEAGRFAPTAMNLQPQKIYVLKSQQAIEKIRGVTKMAYNAPVVMLVCYDKNLSWKNTLKTFGEEYDGGEMDACVITSHMMMQATELGLGTVWIRGYNSRKIIEAFELPENIKPVCLLLVGYPAADSKPKQSHRGRKDLSETVEVL